MNKTKRTTEKIAASLAGVSMLFGVAAPAFASVDTENTEAPIDIVMVDEPQDTEDVVVDEVADEPVVIEDKTDDETAPDDDMEPVAFDDAAEIVETGAVGDELAGDAGIAVLSDVDEDGYIAYSATQHWGIDANGHCDIPMGTSMIPANEFMGIGELKRVTIPVSVTAVNPQAFRNCSNLETVDFALNGNLQLIGQYAFADTPNLVSFTFPTAYRMPSIQNYAFQNTGIKFIEDLVNCPIAPATLATNPMNPFGLLKSGKVEFYVEEWDPLTQPYPDAQRLEKTIYRFDYENTPAGNEALKQLIEENTPTLPDGYVLASALPSAYSAVDGIRVVYELQRAVLWWAIDIDGDIKSVLLYADETPQEGKDYTLPARDGYTPIVEIDDANHTVTVTYKEDKEDEPADYKTTLEQVLDRALAELGKPYQWGAVGPDAYDTSGLVGYCLTGQHIRIGNTATFLDYPSVDEPMPGDIVANAVTCGIYIGGGQMVAIQGVGRVVSVVTVPATATYHRAPWVLTGEEPTPDQGIEADKPETGRPALDETTPAEDEKTEEDAPAPVDDPAEPTPAASTDSDDEPAIQEDNTEEGTLVETGDKAPLVSIIAGAIASVMALALVNIRRATSTR